VRTALASYGAWVLVAACCASLLFALGTTFLEGPWLAPWRIRVRLFRWWHQELTAAQIVLDLCLAVVLIPASLATVFGVDILRARTGSVASLWYYATGLTLVALATLWRTEATMRSKATQRRQLEQSRDGK
jgi:hypothetical protein